MRGSVIVLTGPPGAGKSTTARALAEGFVKAVHLHTDDFWHYIVAGMIPPYLPASHEQNQTVVRVIAAAAYGYAEGGYTVVVDGILGPWMLDHYRDGLQERPGLPVHYLCFGRIVTRPWAAQRAATAQTRWSRRSRSCCSGTSSRT